MSLEYTKATLAAAWIVAFFVVGLLADVTSSGMRLVLAAGGIVPPLAMLLFWHGPSQTMSEIIQRGRQ
jgi:hypothetical protein